ncbi:MAG: TolC family protein [Candidatus Margulisiibacteriota bacterium]
MTSLFFKIKRQIKIWGVIFGLSVLWQGVIFANETNFQAIDDYLKMTPEARQKIVQEYLSKPLTEETVLKLSFIQSPDLKAGFQELWARKSAYLGNVSIENPVLGASVLPQSQGSKIDISLEQDLLKLLIVPMQSRAADTQFEADKLAFSETLLEQCEKAKKALVGYQAIQDIWNIQLDFTEAAKATFELTQKQFVAGNISELQLKTNEAEYQDALAAQHKTDLMVQESKLQLQDIMGLDPGQTEWTVTGSLSEALPQIPSPDEVDKLIETQRPDLASLRARLDSEKNRLDALEWQNKLGSLKAGIQYEQEFDGTKSIGPKIEFGIPLFNQGQWASKEHKAVTAQLFALLEAHQRRAQYSSRKIIAQLHYHLLEIDRSKKVLIPTHQRVTELTQQHYNYMLVGVYTLIQAKQDELKARQEYVHHLEEFWMAWAELEKEVGGKIPSQGENQ